MIDVNLSGQWLLQGDDAEVQELKAANQKWTQACSALQAWENQLHLELLQCQVGKQTFWNNEFRFDLLMLGFFS